MRLLSRYILKQLIMPFLFSLLIIIFVLFTQFLLRAIDRFLGKGLETGIILEYLFLNLGWIAALSVPMAVLIAALMSFGQLSEDNEITAMRASGISFLVIIRPALIFGISIALLLTYFNNFIMPEMNFKARMLSGDIYRKRPDMNIEPGHFVDDLPEYSMIIKGKSGKLMNDVRIFSKGGGKSQTSIYSNQGELNTIDDAIILTLYDGEIHELDLHDYGNYRRIEFKTHVITISVDNIFLNRRDTTSRSDREMTIPMILNKKNNINSRLQIVDQRIGRAFMRAVGDSIIPPNHKIALAKLKSYKNLFMADTTINIEERTKGERKFKTAERQLKNEYSLIQSYNKTKNKYFVEIHKKFSLPAACILFVITGASLGVLFRKGGFAIATGLSFGFFLIYYILLIGGEDMADRDYVSPAVGMWTPNIILFIIALYLMLITVREQAAWQFNWRILSFMKKKDKK